MKSEYSAKNVLQSVIYYWINPHPKKSKLENII